MENNLFKNPRTITLLSLIIGYILISDYTALEQNAIGNFLITIGQILEENSAIEQAFQASTYKNNYTMNYKTNFDTLLKDESIKELRKILKEFLDKISSLDL